MKITTAVKSALVVATLSLPALSSAQPASMAKIKLALKVGYSLPGTFEREDNGDFTLDGNGDRVPAEMTSYSPDWGLTTYNEQAYKLASIRFGNRELLEDLFGAGAFPAGTASIKGWSLVQVSLSGTNQTYLYKKDSPPVKVTNVLALQYTPFTGKGTIKTKVKKDSAKGPVISTVASGALAMRGLVSVVIADNFSGFNASLTGVGSINTKPKVPAGSTEAVSLLTVKSTTLAPRPPLQGESTAFLVEGSIATTSATVVEDLEESFPDFLP